MSSYLWYRMGKNVGGMSLEAQLAFTGVLVLFLGGCAGIGIYDIVKYSKLDEKIDKISDKVAYDLNCSSFSANTLEIKATNGKYIAKICGDATNRRGGNSNYTQAYYLIANEEDFNYIKSVITEEDKAETFTRLKDLSNEGLFKENTFFENLLDILRDGEFLGTSAENIAVADDGQIVVNASEPFVDEVSGTIGYNVTLAKMAEDKLKLATYQVSAPLTQDLANNQTLVYALTKDNCKIELIDKQTINNVNNVEMYGDYAVVL